jgi:4-amino-4-deoxy-L-arabinose transferase-like glycosyltransferase
MLAVDSNLDAPGADRAVPLESRGDHGIVLGAVLLLCAFALFAHLGAAALFDPDEGRNAEKAREILLLHDWITPRQNFVPVLDKPIAYYWLVASSYRAFGISEWSARLPSALAAAGCALLVFLFARRFFGFWEGLWSSLILVTSLEFFLLARIVIFDMTLTFFTTLALFAFFCALHEPPGRRRTALLGAMYIASAAATLVKGPIGVALPGIVALSYLVVTRQLSQVRKLGLGFGIPLFLVVAAPWYFAVEQRNPGYLRYFFWEENFIRYTTPHFNRTEGWSYFLAVLAIGFLPWTLCIPQALHDAWRRREDTPLFLLFWTVLPFLFFSFSNAKLPHYILPIFPPLALLTGIQVENEIVSARARGAWPVALACLGLCSLIAFFLIAVEAPQIFSGATRLGFSAVPLQSRIIALFALIGAAGLGVRAWRGQWKSRTVLLVGLSCVFILYLDLVGQTVAASSAGRSARDFAAGASPHLKPGDQLVIYDTELESLLFYLKISAPMWIVWSGHKASVMGSFYLAEKGVRSAPGATPVLLTFAQFAEQLSKEPEKHVAVFIKAKNLTRLGQEMSRQAVLFDDRGLLLVAN